MFSMRIKLYEVELDNLADDEYVYVMMDDHSIKKAHFIDNEYHAEDGSVIKPKYWISGEINTLIDWSKEKISSEQPSVVL